MITHKDRMGEHATHSEFYRDIIAAAGCRISWPAGFVELLRREYATGNVHFNQSGGGPREFALYRWDNLALQVNTSALHHEVELRGTWVSPAVLVCVAKELACMECEAHV